MFIRSRIQTSLGKHAIYNYQDENGDTSYIRRMVTYEDGSNVYTKNEDGTYTDGDGHVGKRLVRKMMETQHIPTQPTMAR